MSSGTSATTTAEPAQRIGLTVYTQGMIMGVILVGVLLALGVVALSLWSSITWDRYDTRIVVSIVAGALGAFVSVLQRISSSDKTKFTVHYDLGKRTLYMLGSYRPVLGAVFGVFTYFVLASGILQTKTLPDSRTALYYYGSLAFVAGFSERFTQVLAKSVDSLVPAQGTTNESDSGPSGGDETPEQSRDRAVKEAWPLVDSTLETKPPAEQGAGSRRRAGRTAGRVGA